ncbi:MAG: EscU/YscU/HrcU family type III secretion system export apparatus switch protein [Planctomycetes bacterium]|nr:EscU/YscU/HrcU family type III secretion system export apparatus switch protein [Planctomycetota bacterium]
MASDRQVAVALQYVRAEDEAPRVVAKGRGALAERILDLARKHGVPVHQDTDLVEVLVKLDLGDLIPPELYKAVAEILAHLYKMNRSFRP